MHGIIFNQLIKFVRENHGQEALKEILKDSGVGMKFYDATKAYPDEEIEQIVDAACKKLGITRDMALEAFGEYVAPGLLKVYGAFIKKEWDAMDLLENIEHTIHRSVKMKQDNIDPPTLIIKRKGKDEITIAYSSKRNMLVLGIGIVKAIGKYHNTKLSIKRTGTAGDELLSIRRVGHMVPA